MRSIKELLELMLANQQCFTHGLCGWVNTLCSSKMITVNEAIALDEYIDKNRVSMYSSIDAFRCHERVFWWKVGNIHPRIKWIKKHIKKNC